MFTYEELKACLTVCSTRNPVGIRVVDIVKDFEHLLDNGRHINGKLVVIILVHHGEDGDVRRQPPGKAPSCRGAEPVPVLASALANSVVTKKQALTILTEQFFV